MKYVHPNHTHHPGNETLDYEARKRDDGIFLSAFTNIKTIIEDQIVENDEVTTRVTMQLQALRDIPEHCTNRKLVTITFIDITRIRDNEIPEEWVEFDVKNILSQLQPAKH